jgi:hypothetical protein
LDPALDIWSRVGFKQSDGTRKATLGHEGWRVAMLTGLETREMSAKEWAELAGGADKAKRLAKKFMAYGFGILTKTGKARATRYTLDWSNLLSEQWAEMFLLDDRQRQGKATGDYTKKRWDMNQPRSAEELEVRRRVTGAATYASYLQDALAEAESPEHRKDLERLLHTFAGATVDDWTRWMERA